MALPKTVVEQLTRKPSDTPGVFGQLVVLAGFVFLLSIGSYLAIAFVFKPAAESQLENANDNLDQLVKSVSVEQQNKVIFFYSQAVNLKKILGRHWLVTPLFQWMEKKTLPGVYISKFNLTTEKDQPEVSFTAQSASLNTVVSQLTILERQPEVKQLTFKNAGFSSKGIWEFQVALIIDPSLVGRIATTTAAQQSPQSTSTQPR